VPGQEQVFAMLRTGATPPPRRVLPSASSPSRPYRRRCWSGSGS